MKTGTANLSLHGGKCPAWLFTHMKALSTAIIEVIIDEHGTEEVLRRLADPYWFQALGCVVGFDWHSSGVTTTLCGAIKEGLAQLGPKAGLFLAGGKGRVARNTPLEIEMIAEKFPLSANSQQLIYASKMAAKVDSAAVQDGFQIYHHCFVFTDSGQWAVIQQGMNEGIHQARRYHWLSSQMESFCEEPQAAICCDFRGEALNFVATNNQQLRDISQQLSNLSPEKVLSEIEKINHHQKALTLPQRHSIPRTNYLNRSLYGAYEKQPQNFEELLGVSGVGPGTLRALCLVAEVAYGVKASYSDPVRYSFAHGGKDGYPFPVNEADIENSYTTLNRALRLARAGHSDKLQALKNLAKWHSQAVPINSGTCMEEQSRTISARKNKPPSENPLLVQPQLF